MSSSDRYLKNAHQDLLSNARNNRVEDIKKALDSEKPKLEVNFKDEDGNTALHFAVEYARKEAVDILLQYGSSTTIQNDEGKTPLNVVEDKLNANPNDDNLKLIKKSLEESRQGTSRSISRTSNDDGKTVTHSPKNEQRNKTEERLIPSSSSLNARQDTDNTYYSTGSTMHGSIFQFKLIMFVEQRLRKMGHKFRLASEMEAAEKFDDVVKEHTVRNKQYWSFIQAKHKQDDDAKIKSYDLQSTKDSDPFGILKYLLSLIRIKNNSHFIRKELNDFAIVTNANYDFEGEAKGEHATKWKPLRKENPLKEGDLLYMEGFEVKECKLSSNDDVKMFLKANLLVSALALKEISKFPAVQYELENRAKHITEKEIGKLAKKKLNDLLKKLKEAKKEKSDEDQTDSASLKGDKDKLNEIVRKCNGHRETILNRTNITHVIAIMEKDTDLKEFIDLTEIKSIKDLDKTISALSIIKAALDDAAFDEYFDEFVQKFRFVTDFPNQEKLGDFIKGDLGKTFKLLNADLVSASFEKEMLKIMNCKKGENRFHTKEEADEFEKKMAIALNGLLTSGLSLVYPGELKAHKIRFSEGSLKSEHLKKLNSFLDPEQHDKPVFYLCTQSTRLTAIKLLQILEKHKSYKEKKDSLIFIRFNTLSQGEMKKYIFNAFKLGSHNLLVIDFEDKHDEKTLASILAQVKNILREKKIILISQNLKFKDTSLIDEIEDSTSFKDLDKRSQNLVLRTKVNYQGTTMSLNRLINRNYGAKFFDGKSLARLLNGNQLEIGNENAFSSNGYVEEYYIERTFHRQIIKKDILTNKDQLFFITSTKKEDMAFLERDLLKMGARQNNIVQLEDKNVLNTLNTYKIRIILPPLNQSDQEYYEIFRSLGKNAHWLELHQGTSLFWKLSTGDISRITTKEVVPDEHHFCNVKQFGSKVVILANDAGMGKSTVLTSMARKMKELNDKEKNECEVNCIIRINVNDYANHLSNYDFTENDVDRAIDLVAKMAIPGDATNNIDIKIQRTLFETSLKRHEVGSNLKKPKIVLMFDGFDEICPNYESNTSHLIRELKESNVAQIWVTTRAHEQDHLQKEFGSLAYTLNPLTEEDQKNFLDKYWKWNLTKMTEENPSNYQQILSHPNIRSKSGQLLNDFSTHSDKILQKWNRAILDENRKFTTVPLLLQMLADVTLEMKLILPEKNGLLNLYDQLIDIKLDIHSKEKVKKDPKVVQANCESGMAKYYFHKICMELSVKLFFPNDKSLPSLVNMKLLTDETRNFSTGTGLLILKGSDLVFIHRSFAEYYFSRYLIENMSREEVQKLLFSKIFKDDSYGLICQFFNDRLEKLPESEKQIELTDAAMETMLSVQPLLNTAANGHREIGQLLIDNNAGVNVIGEFGMTPLHLAAKRGHKEIVQLLIGNSAGVNGIDEFGMTPLHHAAESGHKEIVQLLIENSAGVNEIDKHGMTPLHHAAGNGHKEIVQLLIGNSAGVN
ncbi:uncharacterized protein LOC129575921, partial [Sitodiplosis mosellana]|uniref:uncharacterized protein LOC129575921 n=1 Tax=Sitodiplosis mosellana TaxID=263140 RepID=UPI00244509E3